MKWFKHRTDAHRDVKLKKLLRRYGADGYGLYFYCIEIIAGSLDGENITFELEDDAETLGYELKIDSLRVEEIMRYMIELKLFESSGNTITCLKIAKQIDPQYTRNPQLKAIINAAKLDQLSLESLKTVSGRSQDCPEPDKTRLDKIRLDITPSRAKPTGSAPVPIQKIIDKWNGFAESQGLPQVVKRSPTLDGQIRQRWKDDIPELEQWDNFLDYIGQSKFLTGRTQSNGRKPFRATLAWITKLENYAKIAAAEYH